MHRFLNRAISEAEKSPCSSHHGAILFKGSSYLSSGFNHTSAHAEQQAILSFGRGTQRLKLKNRSRQKGAR